MSKVAFYPINTLTRQRSLRFAFAAKLASLAPARLNYTIFSNSGSEANDTALKIIRGYNKLRGKSRKTKILTRTFSYHGVTSLAATSMTGLPGCYQPFDLPLPGFIRVPGPHRYAADTKLDAVAFGKWSLPQERYFVRGGRSHHGLWAARRLVRKQSLGNRSRPDDAGQGNHERLSPPGGNDGLQ